MKNYGDTRTQSVQHEDIEQLIYRILSTENEEIDCGQVADLIARYVEMAAAGEDVQHLLPQVYQHLVQCDACSDMHAVLYKLTVLEAQNTLPDPDDLLDEIVFADPAPSAHQPAGLPGCVAPWLRWIMPSR